MDVMHVNTFQFENLYAYYSWPNVVLPIIGGKIRMVYKALVRLFLTMEKIRLLCNMTFFLLGFLIDKVFGIRLGAVIFATFICLGKIKYYLKSIVFSPINRWAYQNNY